MANYAAAILVNGQAKVTARNQAPEQRRKVPTVMEMALKNQQYSNPNAQDLRVSPLRTVDVHYLTNISAGSGTSKAAVHTGTYGDSGKVNVSYITHVETFSLPRKIGDNNIYKNEELFANLYEMAWKNLRTRHDTSALSYVFANRMQLSKAVVDAQTASANAGTWNETNYALEIDQIKKNRFPQMMTAFMKARKFSGMYDVITDLQIGAELEYNNMQGSGNMVNLAWQLQNMGIAQTQDQISSLYPLGCALIMPQGLLYGLNWNEALNKRGVNAGENSVGFLGTASDPLGSGGVADVSMYTARADTSANGTGGSTQDVVDQWELSWTIGYTIPPLSTSGDSVIHLVAQES